MNLAKLSLHRDNINDREFTGTTIAIDQNDFSKIKKLIEEFNLDLHRLAKKDGANGLVRINIQAFGLVEHDSQEKITEHHRVDKAE